MVWKQLAVTFFSCYLNYAANLKVTGLIYFNTDQCKFQSIEILKLCNTCLYISTGKRQTVPFKIEEHLSKLQLH